MVGLGNVSGEDGDVEGVCGVAVVPLVFRGSLKGDLKGWESLEELVVVLRRLGTGVVDISSNGLVGVGG